ncbi:hypothetical protein FRB96_008681 [Tulasnella sp. 330]|nr:hypothetical protein FRB96_008681 [Tulasnella sp. 330]
MQLLTHSSLMNASSPQNRPRPTGNASKILTAKDGPRTLRILASLLFDSETATFVKDRVVTVSRVTGLITDVSSIKSDVDYVNDQSADIVDLRPQNIVLLPGLVDTHVHLFLGPYNVSSGWDDQVLGQSVAERTIRATTRAKDTLMSGYTTVRDLGTEGAGEADIALRKCISAPMSIIPGPRLFTVTRAIVPSGTYGPKSELHPHDEGVDGVQGADTADGEAECRKVIRRQVGAGADWIKIYGEALNEDQLSRSRLEAVSPRTGNYSFPTFTREEFKALIDTAHSLGTKICAHAISDSTIKLLIELGIDSIEHGYLMTETGALKALQDSNGRTKWNPTLATFRLGGLYPDSTCNAAKRAFQKALKMGGISFATGGDTGTFAHGANALEMTTMIEYGATPREALKWSTLGGWECIRGRTWDGEEGNERLKNFEKAAEAGLHANCAEDEVKAFERIEEWPLGDNDVPFGVIKPGFAADLAGLIVSARSMAWLGLGLDGGRADESAGMDVDDFCDAIQHRVEFVMKGGRVYKMGGTEIARGL